MENILKELDSIFKMVSAIPVSGDSVEIMAAAKNTLRKVYAEVTKLNEETKKNDG